MEKKNTQYAWHTFLSVIVVCYAAFLFFRINSFPNVFLDEGNGMYDAWCMAHYGVDSNLIKNPVYLPGFQGQGQSVLYPLLAGISMRLFGYHIWAFRLPLLLISIFNYALLLYITAKCFDIKESIVTSIVVGTAPWLLNVSRFGMDCNIAPFMASIGALVVYFGYLQSPSKKRNILLTLGAAILGLVAYSYNVGWMYLPLFVLIFSVRMIKKKKITFKELVLPACVLFIVVLPILIFAVRSNIPQLNKDIRILWWTSPCLPVGRVKASFISFDGNVFYNIWQNLLNGFHMYADGTDNLSWNSVGNMGPYYLFTWPFFLAGFITMIRRKKDSDIFILSAEFAMIPVILLVTPNYNHWIFLHFPVLLTIADGIFIVASKIAEMNVRKVFLISMALTYALFTVRFIDQYFDPVRYTGWETGSVHVLQSLHADQYKKVYFDSDNGEFLYFIRFCLPVSPYEYQETRDNPYSKTELGTTDHYANFERIGNATPENDSLFILENSLAGNYEERLQGKKPIASFIFRYTQYDVYEY